jgi:hypothetical protein
MGNGTPFRDLPAEGDSVHFPVERNEVTCVSLLLSYITLYLSWKLSSTFFR